MFNNTSTGASLCRPALALYLPVFSSAIMHCGHVFTGGGGGAVVPPPHVKHALVGGKTSVLGPFERQNRTVKPCRQCNCGWCCEIIFYWLVDCARAILILVPQDFWCYSKVFLLKASSTWKKIAATHCPRFVNFATIKISLFPGPWSLSLDRIFWTIKKDKLCMEGPMRHPHIWNPAVAYRDLSVIYIGRNWKIYDVCYLSFVGGGERECRKIDRQVGGESSRWKDAIWESSR